MIRQIRPPRAGLQEFGSWKGVRNRLSRRAGDGMREKVFIALLDGPTLCP
ncbi:hypothetical protein [Streptomyces sioyaensis]